MVWNAKSPVVLASRMRSLFVLSGALMLASGCGGRSVRTSQSDGTSDASGATAGSGGGPAGGSFVSSAGGSGGTGGSTGGTGGSSSAGDASIGVVATPDATGWIGPDNPASQVGVMGAWFVYGDQYSYDPGGGKCLTVGMHAPSECAQITTPPPPPAEGFPNVNGMLHTAGTAEQLLECPPGLETAGCPEYDYSDMWGAGIGFDFSTSERRPGGVGVTRFWDATSFGVKGIAFDIDHVPLAGIRVEIVIPLTADEAAADIVPLPLGATSEDHSIGSPYWGAQLQGDSVFPPSPLVAGMNRVYWEDIQPPEFGYYTFDPSSLVGVRFHVSSSSGVAEDYDFTISNFTFLLE
jgi:hypothetical protein